MAKYTSENGHFLVATLQTKTLPTYEENLDFLLNYLQRSQAKLIIAPELFLTNFDYENFEKAAGFYTKALTELLVVVDAQIVVLTMTVKEENDFFNRAVVLHNHKIVHQQEKYKLFKLGNEEKYFTAGEKNKIVKFEIDGVSYAILICFELRFKELWREVEGVDVVLIPARWGKSRVKHLETLSRALAIMNQCFVVLSNSADEDMASASAIISPWGEVYADPSLAFIEKKINLKDIKRVRRLINMT
ncbi:MAG: Hydrolase [uncultured Sulfurovum sp.]|uniref:Hydrolase n=1 Tax=uncultured Sulfurovum sp. TaxID=269237 RepID=A0A6S6STJ1_9BACT|nr:MAG: Hydrolase [uncultured Sulfurovum sp.]